jgi:hypothetical protein
MARSKENWAAFFKRSDRKKNVKSRKLAPSLLTVGGRVPHVIGELISVRSDRPIHKNHILTFSAKRRATPTRAEAELQRVLNSLNGGALRGKFKREHVVQRAKDLKKDSDCRRFDITVLRLRNAEIFGDRDWLIKKLRAGWREAKDRENRIIGTSA